MGKKLAKLLGDNYKYYYGAYYTKHNGYDITIKYDYTSLLYNMTLNIKGKDDITALNKLLSKKGEYIVAKYKNNLLTITEACDHSRDIPNLINNILDDLTKYLKDNNYKNICKLCNNDEKTTLVSIDDNINFVCNKCIKNIEKNYNKELEDRKKIKENIPLGIIGAIVGCIPGLILWILLSYLMINPAVIALIIMFGSAYFYRYMAKSMKLPGLIISILIGFIFVIFANEIANAYTLYSEYVNQYNIKIIDAYKAIPYYLQTNDIFRHTYNQNLILSIMFFVFGSFTNIGIFRNYIATNKVKNLEVK